MPNLNASSGRKNVVKAITSAFFGSIVKIIIVKSWL